MLPLSLLAINPALRQARAAAASAAGEAATDSAAADSGGAPKRRFEAQGKLMAQLDRDLSRLTRKLRRECGLEAPEPWRLLERIPTPMEAALAMLASCRKFQAKVRMISALMWAWIVVAAKRVVARSHISMSACLDRTS